MKGPIGLYFFRASATDGCFVVVVVVVVVASCLRIGPGPAAALVGLI